MIRVVSVRGLKRDAREGICYVGRQFAGWPASPWGNPFKPDPNAMLPLEECLTRFRRYAESQPSAWLEYLWAACEHGAKPLGCWCVNAAQGDGSRAVCHAQILAEMLHERFVQPKGSGS